VPKTLRTEEWTVDVDWGVSTALINVFEGEVVHVSDSVMVEMGLTLGDYPQGVENESFYHVVPYEEFRNIIGNKGFSHAGTS
jgi:hypothetical protein